jgi:hypothetical protein
MLLTRENGEGIQIAHEEHDGGSLQHWFQGLLVYNHQTTSRHHKKHQRNLQFFFFSAWAVSVQGLLPQASDVKQGTTVLNQMFV